MTSTKLSMTVQTPSRFGMPICGHAVGATRRVEDALAATSALVVRGRIAGTTDAVAVKAGFVPSAIQGTTAWRPPSC